MQNKALLNNFIALVTQYSNNQVLYSTLHFKDMSNQSNISTPSLIEAQGILLLDKILQIVQEMKLEMAGIDELVILGKIETIMNMLLTDPTSLHDDELGRLIDSLKYVICL